MTPIETLKEQEQKLSTELRSVRDKIDKMKVSEQLPKLKKKYEGTYWKYKNSYSCPENPSDYWFLYKKVIQVKDLTWLKTLEFQTDKYGTLEIKENSSSVELLQTKITKKEFDAAYKKAMNKLTKLIIA